MRCCVLWLGDCVLYTRMRYLFIRSFVCFSFSVLSVTWSAVGAIQGERGFRQKPADPTPARFQVICIACHCGFDQRFLRLSRERKPNIPLIRVAHHRGVEGHSASVANNPPAQDEDCVLFPLRCKAMLRVVAPGISLALEFVVSAFFDLHQVILPPC